MYKTTPFIRKKKNPPMPIRFSQIFHAGISGDVAECVFWLSSVCVIGSIMFMKIKRRFIELFYAETSLFLVDTNTYSKLELRCVKRN